MKMKSEFGSVSHILFDLLPSALSLPLPPSRRHPVHGSSPKGAGASSRPHSIGRILEFGYFKDGAQRSSGAKTRSLTRSRSLLSLTGCRIKINELRRGVVFGKYAR